MLRQRLHERVTHAFERESNRIVIAGASSLLGAELKSLLEGSRFAASISVCSMKNWRRGR